MTSPPDSELLKFTTNGSLCTTICKLIQNSDASAVPDIQIVDNSDGKSDMNMSDGGAILNDDELDDLVEEQLILNKIKEMQTTRRNLEINRLQANKGSFQNSVSVDKNNDESDSMSSFMISDIGNDYDRCKEDLDRLSKALTLNIVMQSELNKLEIFLIEKLKQNQVKQVEVKNEISRMTQTADKVNSDCLSRSCYSKYGIPYFKDEKKFSCDYNPDVKKMRYCNQMLSINFRLCKMWKLKEKALLEEGVRSCLVQENIAELVVQENQMKKALPDININTKKIAVKQEIAHIERKIETLKRKTLTNLFANCPADREFDWVSISIDHVRAHSDLECQRMWHLYAKPSVNKVKWTPKEDNRLLELIKKYQKEDWDTIAEELGTSRTGYQCFVNYQTRLNKEMRKLGKWTEEEDKMLASLVTKCRVGHYIPWAKIAYYFQSRSLSQIYCRWNSSLNPDLKKGRFTRHEDKKIVTFVRKFGEDFSKISKLIGDRTSVQIRERYLRAIPAKYLNTGRWSLDEDKLLMCLVKKHGISNWSAISNQFVTRTRTQVRQRYAIIKKILEKNPAIELEDIHRGPSAQSRSVLPPVTRQIELQRSKEPLLADLIERNQIEEELLKKQNSSLMTRIKAGRKKKFKRSEVDTKLITYFKEAYTIENLKLKTYYVKPDIDNAVNALAVFCQFLQTHITLPEKNSYVYKKLPLTLRNVAQKMQERFTNWGCDCLGSDISRQSNVCFCQEQNFIDYLPVDQKSTLVDDALYLLSSVTDYQKPIKVKRVCKCLDNRAKHFIFHYLPPNIITSIAFRSTLLIKDKIAISLTYDRKRTGFFSSDVAEYQGNEIKKFTGFFSDEVDSSEDEDLSTPKVAIPKYVLSESTTSDPSTSSGSTQSTSKTLYDRFKSTQYGTSSDKEKSVERLSAQEAIHLWKERLIAILGWPIVLSNQPPNFSCNTGFDETSGTSNKDVLQKSSDPYSSLGNKHTTVPDNANLQIDSGIKRRKIVEVDQLKSVSGRIFDEFSWDECNQQTETKVPKHQNCDTMLSSDNEVDSKTNKINDILFQDSICDEFNESLNQIKSLSEVSDNVVEVPSNHTSIKKLYKCYSRKRARESGINN